MSFGPPGRVEAIVVTHGALKMAREVMTRIAETYKGNTDLVVGYLHGVSETFAMLGKVEDQRLSGKIETPPDVPVKWFEHQGKLWRDQAAAFQVALSETCKAKCIRKATAAVDRLLAEIEAEGVVSNDWGLPQVKSFDA